MTVEATKFKIRKKTLGSYPYVSVIFSITLALLVIGIFGLMLLFSSELERNVLETVRIQVFLKNNLTDAQRTQLEKNLLSRPFIPTDKKESAIQFISREEAAKTLIKETGQDFQALLGENPLRGCFLVAVDPRFQDPESLLKIKKEVEQVSGVFEVVFSLNLIQEIHKNMTQIGLVAAAIASLLLLTVFLLINNTLRLALFSQRFLVRSMQLVGARRWFIQRPFLFRAALHGAVAGVIASAVLTLLISYGNSHIEDLRMIENDNRIGVLFAGLVAIGIFVAVFSTFRSIHKYLKLSLDELY